MTLRRLAVSLVAFVAVVAVVMTARYVVFGCVADRFGRCIELWMITEYPVRTVLVGALGIAMAAWRADDG